MKKISMVFLLSAAISGSAFAESGNTIAELNEKIAIMGAQIRLLEAELQMAQKNKDLAKLKGTTEEGRAGLPSLRSIEGVNGSMYATFSHAEGGDVTVEKGERLPGGWAVVEIRPKSVTLSNGKERKHLTLRMAATPHVGTTGATGAPNLMMGR